MADMPILTHDQAIEILEEVCRKKIPVMLWGPPGIGKSYIVRELANKLGAEYIDIRLSQIDPVDIRGVPVPNYDEKITEYYPPSFLPHPKSEEGKKLKEALEKFKSQTVSGKRLSPEVRGIMFLDELNLAPPAVQNAAYQLILDRRVGDYEVPPDWAIIAAGNPIGQTKGIHAYPMPSPLANRFIHFELAEPTKKTWYMYMIKKIKKKELEDGVVEALIDFVKTYDVPLLGQQEKDAPWPSPRSWEYAATLIQGLDPIKDRDKIRKLVASAVGVGPANEFVKYLKNLSIDIKDLLNMSIDEIERLLTVDKRRMEAAKAIEKYVERLANEGVDKVLNTIKQM